MGVSNPCEMSVFCLQVYPVIFDMFKYILFVVDASVFKVFCVPMVGFLPLGALHVMENRRVTQFRLESHPAFWS